MPSKEVITFWLDMGAPISLLSRVIARLRSTRVACIVKSARQRQEKRAGQMTGPSVGALSGYFAKRKAALISTSLPKSIVRVLQDLAYDFGVFQLYW